MSQSNLQETLKQIAEAMVIDVETTVKCPIGNTKGASWYPDNWIVTIGAAPLADPDNVEGVDCSKEDKGDGNIKLASQGGKTKLIVGHNLSFDMNWLRASEVAFTDHDTGKVVWSNIREFYKEGSIWDTAIAEYLLSGQSHTFPSLDTLMEREGLPMKDSFFKDAWKNGGQTEDFDVGRLLSYMNNDITQTGHIANKQMFLAQSSGMLPFITSQMAASMAVHEMEFNGMAVDTALLAEIKNTNDAEAYALLASTHVLLHDMLSGSVPINIVNLHVNVGSNKQLGAIIFGGTIEYTEKEQDGYYKNGRPKMRNVTKQIVFPPAATGIDKFKETTKAGNIIVDAAKLTSIVDHYSRSVATDAIRLVQVLKNILRISELAKETSTYCEGLAKLADSNSIVHHGIHETSTATGRRSSSNPNGQNLPSAETSDIKKAFVSRWGDDGIIIEADYSQLEVIALAFITNDTQLRQDIIAGVDVHKATGSRVFGSNMSKTQRRIAKTINFGLIYGGGAATLAKQAGVDVMTARSLINAFYSRYPEVKLWQQKMQKEVEAHGEYCGDSVEGMPVRRSVVSSITGRRYTFVEDMYKGRPTFSPTKIKNYFIQGFATGDVVPMVLGKVFKTLLNDRGLADNCLMINTVHDSILFDCRKEHMQDAVVTVKRVMEDAPRYLKEDLGVNFDLPLTVEVEAGKSWGEMVKVG